MRRLQAVVMVAVAGACLCGPLAKADITLTLIDGTHTVAVTDNGSNDSDPTSGLIAYVGPLLGTPWTVNSTSGATAPPLALPQLIELNSFNIDSSSAAKLQVLFTATDLTLYDLDELADIVVILSAPPGSSIRNIARFYGNNDPSSTGTVILDQTFGPGSFSTFAINPVSISGPYAVTEEFDLDLKGRGSVSASADIAGNPEPASLILLGTVLLGLTTYLRKRFDPPV